MYHTDKTYITKDKKLLGLINENHQLLLCLQHFNIDFAVENKTVERVCGENNIDLTSFLTIANLYNNFYPSQKDLSKITNILSILTYLKNSHEFYVNDKYPELEQCLDKLKNGNNKKALLLIEQFLKEYFDEVLEHLKYEDEVAFPYFYKLESGDKQTEAINFSAKEYKNHHTDIETKLTDLKNLFLQHLIIDGTPNIKRKFLVTLFELEFDLKIHSIIEEKILIPLIERMENK